MPAGRSAPSLEAREQRERLLGVEGRIRGANEHIEAATRAALETEEIGIAITQDLRSQSETIVRTRHNVRRN